MAYFNVLNPSMINYLNELPFLVQRELCSLLDQNDKWEELAGVYMKYSMQEITLLRQSKFQSPSKELLSKYAQQNHTISELFVHLSKMQHHQAMLVLKPYIDPKYHVLIYKGEENITSLLNSEGDESSSCSNPMTNTNIYNDETVNISTNRNSPSKFEEKILNI